jgi:hypothetical protein
MRNLAVTLFLLAVVFVTPMTLHAQDVSAMTGVVTDSTGAALPGTTVTLTNSQTGLSFTQTSDGSGTYRFTNIPPGPGYSVGFAHAGFATSTVDNVYLNVAITRTQNVKLSAGERQTVEVSASNSGVTLNTTDASVGNNFDATLLNNLPVQARDNPAALFTLQPGVTLNGAVTGARVDQDNVTLDGLDVNDFATGNAFVIVAKAPIDSIQEFRGITAGFPTNSGPGGGGQFQLVTKSGTNNFHGNINEYHRDVSTVANDWFNNNSGIARPKYIQNQFGGGVGGPIKHDRAFFFFDFNDSRIIQTTSIIRTVPLDSYRNGNLSYIRAVSSTTGAACLATSRENTTPDCIGTLTPAQVTALDPAGIGENQALFTAINGRFPHANDVTGGDGVNTGAFRFNAPNDSFETNYVGRLDYNLTSKIKLFARANVIRQNAVQFPVEFPGDPETNPFIDRSYAYVGGITWALGANKFNNFYYGQTVADPSFPNTYNPQGLNPLSFTGVNVTFLSNTFFSPANSQGRHVPIPVIGDDFTWVKGNHSMAFGGTFKYITSQSNTKLDYNTYAIGLGGNVNGLTASLRPAAIRGGTTAPLIYDNAFAFALGRVGAISSNFNYDNQGNPLPQGTGDDRSYRYYQTQLYVGDTWKVFPSLTLSYGLNWQIFSVPYELHGLESVENFTFDDYFNARVAQSSAGKTGNSAVPLISYVLGGKANNGPDLYHQSNHDIAPRFAFAFNPAWERKMVVNGGAGIVYDRTVINAVQFQQDQYSYLFQQSINTTYGTTTDPVGSLKTDPRIGANFALPAVTPPPAIQAPYQPFVSAGVPGGLQNGQAFNQAIDPNLKTPYSIGFNAGVQYELPSHFILKASYVGRLGRRLLAQADANQVIDFADPASGQLLSSAFAAVTTQLRSGTSAVNLPAQPFFEHVVIPGIGASQTYKDSAGVVHHYANNTDFLANVLGGLAINGDIADFVQGISSLTPPNVGMAAQFSENTFFTNKGVSNYNGLLVTLTKNLSHGLQFDVNYTYSHSIDNTSLVANTSAAAGYGFVCDVLRTYLCVGNSDFDVKHILAADVSYALPFGRGRTFGGHTPTWLNEVIGGWDVSGITRARSGVAFGTVSSAFVAGYANNAPAILVGDKSLVAEHTHKTADGSVQVFADQAAAQGAFVGPIGFNIGARNNLRGPKFFNQDMGLAKTFGILPDHGVNLKFRADAFNVFNHPNFATPLDGSNAVDFTNSSFGQITATTNAGGTSPFRVAQFSLRVEF